MGVILSVAAGLLAWTFLEYVLHDFVGHRPKGRNQASKEHLLHHARTDYFTSWPKKMALAVPVLGSTLALGTWLLGPVVGVSFTAGIAAGWVAYEQVHRSLHVRAPRGRYGRWARRHHFHHHFSNPRRNHGVTTPLWDWVFGTLDRPSVVRVPRKHAPRLPWLLQEGTGQVDPRFADEYSVV